MQILLLIFVGFIAFVILGCVLATLSVLIDPRIPNKIVRIFFDPLLDRAADVFFFKFLHPRMRVRIKASEEASEYVMANMPKALQFDRREDLLRYCSSRVEIED